VNNKLNQGEIMQRPNIPKLAIKEAPTPSIADSKKSDLPEMNESMIRQHYAAVLRNGDKASIKGSIAGKSYELSLHQEAGKPDYFVVLQQCDSSYEVVRYLNSPATSF
jgi:hypothetical protein